MKKLFEKTMRYREGPMACVLRRDCRMSERRSMDRTLAGDWDARVEHRSMAETRMRSEARNGENAEAARSTEHSAGGMRY